MVKNTLFFIKLFLLLLSIISNSYAAEVTILPLKKPILDEKTINEKISQSIIKPKSKPTKIQLNKDKDKVAKVVDKKINYSIPKSKPLIVKKIKPSIKNTSKYYSQKDFAIAKKSIQAMEKSQWSSALSISKKARDKSIYNFVQWRHLLTSGNQATFYDYLVFLKNNDEYPRINRIRYLAEKKLSTEKISPKKIIDWFNSKEPLSGYGELILGESFIQTGNIEKGVSLIKKVGSQPNFQDLK